MPHPAADRGSATVAVATAAALQLLLLAAVVGAVAGITGQEASACTAQPAASSTAASIPRGPPRRVQSRGNRVRHPLDRPGRLRRSRKRRRPRRRAVQRRRPRPDAVPALHLVALRRRRQHNGPRRRHPRRRPPADRQRRARQPPARPSSPTTTRPPTSPTCWTSPPATPPEAPRSSPPPAAPCPSRPPLGPLPAGTAGKILAFAEAQLGKPYLYGATGSDAYDCSGLVMMAYRAAGIAIPRTSQAQWAYGTQIPASQVQPGDLVFFSGADGTPPPPGTSASSSTPPPTPSKKTPTDSRRRRQACHRWSASPVVRACWAAPSAAGGQAWQQVAASGHYPPEAAGEHRPAPAGGTR